MEGILRADVFFVVTTVVVVLVGAAILTALYYAIRILRNAQHISQEISEETEAIIEDVDMVRKGTTRGGSVLLAALSRLILGAFKKRKQSKRKKN
jgi:hypothetical protein